MALIFIYREKRNIIKKKIILWIVLCFFFTEPMFSQARLNISSGSSVNFYFNSLQKYQNGISYNDFTKLNVQYRDTTAANTYPHWRIDVKALTTKIIGDMGNDLDLDVLELSATGPAPGISSGRQVLQTTESTLFSGANETIIGGSLSSETVSVSYFCGTNVSLIGEKEDYYVVDILFTLIGY